MGKLIPKLEVLPDRQVRFWERLGTTPPDFVLYGGTALVRRGDLVEGVAVASLIDLFGMKCATITQRSELKDYLDIHALLEEARLELRQGIAAARAIYGRQYDPLMTLQALSYFDDLRPHPDENVRSGLLAAVKSTSLDDLPVIEASATTIGAGVDGRGG